MINIPYLLFCQNINSTEYDSIIESSKYRRLARKCFVEGDFSKSIELYNESLRLVPNVEVYYAKATVYLEIGNRLDSVMAVYSKISDAYSEYVESEISKDLSSGLFQLYYERGLLYYISRDFEKSIYELKKLIEMRKDEGLGMQTFRIFTLLGNAYYAINEIDSAILFYNKRFEWDESDEVGMYIKGDYFEKFYNGNLEVYDSVLNDGIQKYPNFYSYYMYRGELRLMKNDFVGALDDFRNAAALKVTTHNWVNKAGMEWKVGSREQAMKDFALAIEINLNKLYEIKDMKRGSKYFHDYIFEYMVETTKKIIDENKD